MIDDEAASNTLWQLVGGILVGHSIHEYDVFFPGRSHFSSRDQSLSNSFVCDCLTHIREGQISS